MNSVVLIGRLTRDPEVRYTAGTQMAVCTFTVAIDRPVRAGGEKQTDFPRVTVFGKQAENCERFLAKGRLVGVQGRIQTGSYTNRDGQKVYTTDVVAEEVEFAESKATSDALRNNSGMGGGYQPQAPSAPSPSGAAGDGFMNIPDGIDEELPFN